MIFENKTILIISPQSWSDMHVSKHNYAIELSKRKNRIYFLQPSSMKLEKDIQLEILTNYRNITVIHHKRFIGSILRFHARPIYKVLLKIHIKNILKKINPIDIIFSFDNTATYPDLSLFKAHEKIFFPVDQINTSHIKEYKNFGNTIFSISPVILESFSTHQIKKVLLKHGLGSNWALYANKQLRLNTPGRSDNVRVGYFGNLTIGKSLDMKTLTEVIETHPDIDFHFWGNYELKDTIDKEICQWISFLKSTKNVTLYGAIPPNKLVNQIEEIDAFLICYNYQYEINKCSNSHKILEYLSTGKSIISSKISTYQNQPSIIKMLPDFDNKGYNSLFNKTIKNIKELNNIELKKKRIEFALANTYEKQITRIENYINNNI